MYVIATAVIALSQREHKFVYTHMYLCLNRCIYIIMLKSGIKTEVYHGKLQDAPFFKTNAKTVVPNQSG